MAVGGFGLLRGLYILKARFKRPETLIRVKPRLFRLAVLEFPRYEVKAAVF